MQRTLIPLIMVFLTVVLVACQSKPSTPEPTAAPDSSVVTPGPNGEDNFIVDPLQMDDETGVVRGRIISASTDEPLASTVVALAQVTRQGDEGAFVLNSASSPMNVSDVDGQFIIPNVPPGEFVMIVGDPYERHEIIENPDTQMAQTYFVEPGMITEVGEVSVDIGK